MRSSAVVLLLLLACGGGGGQAPPEEDDVPIVTEPGIEENFGVAEEQGSEDCENLSLDHCLLPWPSDRFRGEEGLAFGPTSLIQTTAGVRLDAADFAVRDGFSPVTPVLFRFDGASLDGTAEVGDIAASLEPDSKTVVLSASTGERVAHWVELDHFSVAGEKPVFVIRFPKRLDYAGRYVVGVRGLAGATVDGGFAALRDRTASRVVGIHARRARFETDVFGPLEEAGVAREDLQLAFDFTVASEQNTTQLLLAVRDAVLAQATTLTIDDVQDPNLPSIARIVYATAHVPGVLLPADAIGARRIRTGDAGEPIVEGTEAIPLEIQIPHSALEAAGPVPALQYGHGLFGSRAEARNGWLREFAQRKGFVIFACDMQGMSEADIAVWGVALTGDVSLFARLAEKPLQGIVNHLAIARAMKAWSLDAEGLAIDPERVTYYGNSQGGTMGSVIMALQPDLPRGVLGVPGGAYAFLLNRSTAFSDFAGILAIPFPDPVDFTLAFALLQTAMDPMDPLSYVHLIHQPLLGSPQHRVLLHVAKEDSQVQNDVSFLLGRSIGASLMVPTPRPIWGFEERAYPFEGSAVVEFDFGKPDNPNPTEPPPSEHDTHADLRVDEAAQDQLWHFLQTGEVVAP